MAGGVGARFWPLSRISRPKQFIDIFGAGETLIQQTFRRLTTVCPPENIFVVTHEMYKDQVLEQLPQMKADHVLCEPMRRNTAPCIAYACHKIAKLNPDAKIVVAPSDHIILKEDVFTQVLTAALETSSISDCLLTLGIKPSRPETGYGYIQFKENELFGFENCARKVVTFTEKPQYDLAVSFVQSGDFLWNSGIFIWSLQSILKAFDRHLPDVNALFSEIKNEFYTPNEAAAISTVYSQCQSISIDYGIMEKSDNVYVIPADFGWSDLGTWGSLYDNSEKNEHRNALIGDSVFTFDTENSIINLPDGKVAIIQGLNDYIVVEDAGTLLICRKSDEQRIKTFVETVRAEKGENFV